MQMSAAQGQPVAAVEIRVTQHSEVIQKENEYRSSPWQPIDSISSLVTYGSSPASEYSSLSRGTRHEPVCKTHSSLNVVQVTGNSHFSIRYTSQKNNNAAHTLRGGAVTSQDGHSGTDIEVTAVKRTRAVPHGWQGKRNVAGRTEAR
jgi:hypothetical protein